jgi:hypothetical protein
MNPKMRGILFMSPGGIFVLVPGLLAITICIVQKLQLKDVTCSVANAAIE